MAISMTPAAADRVRSFLSNRGKGLGLRVGVKTTGCSGMAYTIEYVDVQQSDDVAFEQHGITIVVDSKSLPYLDGTELDYAREGLNVGFKFSNPNERDRCGCGESFRV